MSKTMELPPFTDAIRNRLICLLWLTTMAVSLAAHGEQAPEGGYHHRFQNAEQWSRIFDDPGRDQWQKPEQVIAQLQLQPDAKVADIGAGTGYFAMRLAKKIPSGIVYAIDVEPDMAAFLDRRAKKEGLGNIRTVLADADNPKIPEPVDLIFVCDTYHHIGHRSDYFRKLHASLLPQGRIVIVDYYKNKSTPVGPPPEARIDPGQVIKELAGSGFRFIRQDDSLDYQYVLFFESRPDNESPLTRTRTGKP
jgi:SAM-dependent methyltransferase